MNNEILNYTTTIHEIDKLIHETDELINNHFNEINKLLTNEKLQTIFNAYNQHIEDHKNAGFNIFNLISDKYYYENFHSDIISTFLDSTGEHNEGNKFLRILLDLLRKIRPELKISLDDFKKTSVVRENHRIDILIQDLDTKKAIIVENKINNATDTKRQLPRYITKIGRENVVAIVYLPLDPGKEPVQTGWEPDEIDFINSKLIRLPAFNRTENDFFEGWLQPCIREAENEDSKVILKQYSKLIQKIGGLIMDNKLFKDFYKVLNEKENFKTAMSIVSMISELPSYLAMRIEDKFRNNYSPFNNIKSANNSTTFDGYKIGNNAFKLVITCKSDNNSFKYSFRFWDQDYYNNGIINAKKIIEDLGYSDNFSENSDATELERRFKFPEEEQNLYGFVEEFKEKLNDLKNSKLLEE
jgi:PD-(D/E)XK nuclease superfamily